MVRTITRAELVRVGQLTLKRAKEGEYEITDEMCELVMEAARRVPRVAGDGTWWEERGECGCFVGWVLRDPPDLMRQPGWEQIGYSYLEAMEEVLGDRWTHTANVLEVVNGF